MKTHTSLIALGVAAAAIGAACGGTARQAAGTVPPSLPMSAQASAVLLRGSGVNGVAFGTGETQAVAHLDQLLGRPGSSTHESPVGNCGLDATVQYSTLTAYFADRSFVGYSVSASAGQEATATGLRVGDPLSTAENLYGPALRTSLEQGGAWFAETSSGRLDGLLSSEPNQAGSPPRVVSIDAGDVGCPAQSP